MKKKALVLGTDSRILLSVMRSLGRGGVEVHVGSDDLEYVAQQSRYLHRYHRLPAIRQGDRPWKDSLLALLKREHFDLVMPCTDCEVLACYRHQEELKRFGKVCVPNKLSHEILFDKFKTTELARSVGVPTPREVIVSEARRPEELIDEFGLPLVLKPARTMDPERFMALSKVRKAYSAEELESVLPQLLAQGPVAVQENFCGAGVGVELLLDGGKPLLAFQHRRIHEPLHGGPSSYRQSQALAPDLLAASLKVLGAVAYTGVAMVEFKVNEAVGTWVLLEVNARFWGSLPLALAAGADFPLALFEFMTEGRTQFAGDYRKDVFCRNWTLDYEWQRSNLLADRSDSTLACRPLGAVLKDICFHVATGCEHSDTFTLDDPRPGWAEFFQLAERLGAKLFRSWRRKQEVGRLAIAEDFDESNQRPEHASRLRPLGEHQGVPLAVPHPGP